jgi:hypothetical protein
MMRTLTDHIVEGDSANHQLTIEVMDEPGAGGANHCYQIRGFSSLDNPSESGPLHFNGKILFQNGPIKEAGVNGVTQEALLAIVIDRLRSFQAGPYRTKQNEAALKLCMDALFQLQERTRERLARGVEGTYLI